MYEGWWLRWVLIGNIIIQEGNTRKESHCHCSCVDPLMAFHCTWSNIWIKCAPSFSVCLTFLPFAYQDSGMQGSLVCLNPHTHFHHKPWFVLLSIPGTCYPQTSKWQTSKWQTFSSFRSLQKVQLFRKVGLSPTQSFIFILLLVQPNTLSQSYVLQNIYYYLILSSVLQFICFFLSLEYEYRNYAWLIHYAISGT